MSSRFASPSAIALAMLAGACATQEDVRALRRPSLPPEHAVLAAPHEDFYEAIAIYEIVGAPEHLFFEEGDLLTTRPRRHEIHAWLRGWLGEARMLSPSVRRSRYLLTVHFESLSGPDVWWFSDKSAGARVRYTIEETQSRRVVFDATYDAAFEARMPGVTEEMVRGAVWNGLFGALTVGSVNNVNDEYDAQAATLAIGPLSGLNGALFGNAHDMLGWDREDVWNYGAPSVHDGFWRGAASGVLGASLADASQGNMTDFEAGALGGLTGALGAFTGAAPIGKLPDDWDEPSMIGAFDGTRRRRQVVHGMLEMSFNRFLLGLADSSLVRVRDAVPCEELNPYGRRGPAILVSTRDSVAYDCGARGAEENPHPRPSDLQRLQSYRPR